MIKPCRASLIKKVVVVVHAETGIAGECVYKIHYDNRCDLIQQSMAALKELTVEKESKNLE